MKEFRRNFSYDESTVIDNVPIHAMERQELTNHIRKKRRVVLGKLRNHLFVILQYEFTLQRCCLYFLNSMECSWGGIDSHFNF